MTLPVAPNSISFSQINTEIGNAATSLRSIGALSSRTLANVSSGTIALSNFRGKTALNGSTSLLAAPSAQYIKNLTGTTTNGLYWIKPGTNPTAFQVYCDMNTDGGGWMLVARSDPNTVNYGGTNWGWQGNAIGAVGTYSEAFQAGWWNKWHNYGATFSSLLFGNRSNINNSAWGSFIYKISNINYTSFLTSDTQQGYTNSTVQSDLGVYGSTSFPGMQNQVGFAASGTTNNFYYMRDCCGFAGYGGYATYMNTTYCGSDSVVYYSGPWCGGSAQDGSGNFLSGTYVTAGGNRYGGTNQYMIMVK